MAGSGAPDSTKLASHHGPQALVTRPREEAKSLVVALTARGVRAVVEPMMEVHHRDGAPLDLASVQAILCTSANGVRALSQATGERGLPLLAVGEATASRARAEGFSAVASADGAVADLVRLATTRLRPQNGRLLYVAGNVVAGDLVDALRERGFMIDRNVLYEARPVGALSGPTVCALRHQMIDFALFFSPRTAAIFVSLAGIAGVTECCRKTTALAISSAADAALADLPWRDRRVAARPNQRALLNTLDTVLAERR